jgi:hypothetical protein
MTARDRYGSLASERTAHPGLGTARARLNVRRWHQMISITIPTTTQIPSGFALPISGATFGTGAGMAAATERGVALATYGPAVRDRHVACAALAQGAVPGPTAWSPPIC